MEFLYNPNGLLPLPVFIFLNFCLSIFHLHFNFAYLAKRSFLCGTKNQVENKREGCMWRGELRGTQCAPEGNGGFLYCTQGHGEIYEVLSQCEG